MSSSKNFRVYLMWLCPSMGEMKLSSVTLLFQQRALSSCPLVNLEIDLRDSISSVKMGVYASDPPGNVKATRKANRSSSGGRGSFRPIICVGTVHKLHGEETHATTPKI